MSWSARVKKARMTRYDRAGQIYMPRFNGLLLTGVLLLVALFRSSDALASAYGIAVAGTMVVTCMMAFIVIWRLWHWSLLAAAALMLPFLFNGARRPVRIARNLTPICPPPNVGRKPKPSQTIGDDASCC